MKHGLFNHPLPRAPMAGLPVATSISSNDPGSLGAIRKVRIAGALRLQPLAYSYIT